MCDSDKIQISNETIRAYYTVTASAVALSALSPYAQLELPQRFLEAVRVARQALSVHTSRLTLEEEHALAVLLAGLDESVREATSVFPPSASPD